MIRRLLVIALPLLAVVPVVRARSQTPSATRDTATAMFKVAGVDVIHRRLMTSEIVVAQLYLLGGSRQLTFDNAGIEALALRASEYGTARYPGRLAGLALARTGSTVNLGVARDWSVLELRTVRSELDSAWSVFADRIASPGLSAAAFALARDQMSVAAQFRQIDPDALIAHLADSIAFDGHPYAIEPSGSEHSLQLMRLSDVVAYHREQTVTSRMLLVVVGNVTSTEVTRLVGATLSKLPPGKYAWSLPPELPRRRSALVMIPRPYQTNYLLGYFPGPPVRSPDHPAFRIVTALLGGRLAYRIREQNQLSYAAYAPFLDRAVAGGGVYASTTNPGTVLRLANETLDDTMRETPSWDRMPAFVNQFTIEFLLDQETYDGQASELARAHLLRGDFRQSDAWLQDLKRVSPVTMQNVARWYFNHIQYVYLGDTAKLKRTMR